jgi:U4/U6.U5 tri-snRNP-associated protein 2
VDIVWSTETKKSTFITLTIDVPPPPLFKDSQERNIIPQVGLPWAHARVLEYPSP